MTLGEKISLLRKERGLTQAELGNELGVTYQAVSKWERDDSMPDFDMISKLAKLFGVPISHFENNDDNDERYDVTTTVVADAEDKGKTSEPTSQVIGVCTVCGKYINKDNVGLESPKLVCKACRNEQLAQTERANIAMQQREQAQKDAVAWRFKKRSIIAAVVAGLISITILILGIAGMNIETLDNITPAEYICTLIVMCILLFTWVFQLFFDGVVRSVTLSGLFFIRLPGIIFSADLDGLIFLIVMKILFFIITIVVFVGAIIVTSIAAMLLSIFTFIPVIIKIVHRNEDILDD